MAEPATTRAPFSPPGIVPRADHIPDANQGTFYSSMMNVDVEIGDGNPAAVAIRFHVAQHGVLSHMDFRIGSGLAALIDIGNVGQDLRFFGGRYGILTTNTSPFWPYTLIDSLFDGQRDAAIREHMAGLTVVRTTFRNVPVGISIDRDYSDQLWLKDARFENVTKAAIVIDNERNPTTQIGVADAICSNVPVFARYREERRDAQGAVRPRTGCGASTMGSSCAAPTARARSRRSSRPIRCQALPSPLPPAIRALPPDREWVNVHTLGVQGRRPEPTTRARSRPPSTHTASSTSRPGSTSSATRSG